MKLIINIVLVICLFFNAYSCDSTTDPHEDETEPGRRDYEWTVDTISSPPNLFYLSVLWGSSPTNLWAVGHADETINSIWHYDGNNWKKTTQRLSSNIQSIYGFDSTDIWICDSPGGNVFRYNGSSWFKTGNYSYPGYSLSYLNYIWGPSPDEVYIAGGVYSQEKGSLATLLKYDGTKWKYLDIPEKKMSFIGMIKSNGNNLLYLTGIEVSSTGDLYRIFTYNGNTLDEIYSGHESAYPYDIDGKIYICIGKKIYEHQNNKLVLWQDFSQTSYLGVIGRT